MAFCDRIYEKLTEFQMEKKYISQNRYKKSTGKKRRDISNIRKSNISSNKVKKTNISKKIKPKVKPSVRRERRINRRNIFTCIILLILIAVILRALLREEGEPFLPIFFGSEENTQVITIGVITDEDLLDSNINNIVLKELGYYSNHMLLTVNEDYSLNYDIIKTIQKSSDTEYVMAIKESKEYSANTIKRVLERYMSDKNSIYYPKLKDIQSINVVDEETLKITLNSIKPYFIYNLDVPIASTNKKQYVMTSNSTSISVEFERTKYASEEAPAKIIVKRYKDMYECVEAYKKGIINMLITNQKNVQNMMGRYEYNLKTYRNGETIFLFLNKNSKWLKNEEMRKAITYSIDRDSIVKNIMQSAANVIDLPYVYDVVKYKYDIYAAENLLLSNGYKKQNKVYYKNKEQVVLNLIVNKSDEEKVQIAKAIQNNLSAIGIKVKVDSLSKTDLNKRIKNSNYDLLLSTVNLNNNPDISFLNNNLYITEELNNSILKLEEANIINLPKCISDISKVMSNSISVIGIVAKTNYVIYSKEIVGINYMAYLNIFNSLINETK